MFSQNQEKDTDASENKYAHEKRQLPESENMVWLKLELSKYFGYIALIIMSVGRLLFAKYLDTCPFAAPLIYPLICTQIYSKLVNVILVLMS